ncbi:integrase arm-type DNA-binding domain-containing protein [Rodentibacter caecimuris]|uniref:integrase arm-type DNA-binding domain-containing protein n=1 Tax=Rodentibacter caecimuris TaxID=1796644 RepID=UPI001F400190|nr:integrase arm-type DNA-binding domain-containing protein [Rodentibacter heylii]
MRITKPLTNTEIDKAKPKDKDYTLSDGQGLYLLIKSTGAKLWRFNYYQPFSNPRKRVLLGVGKYPEVSLSQARKVRDGFLSLLAPKYRSATIPATAKRRGAGTLNKYLTCRGGKVERKESR